MNFMKLLTLAAVIATIVCSAAQGAETHPIIYADDFENGFDRWQTSDLDPTARSVWKIVEVAGSDGQPTNALRVTGPSDYQPVHRSPLSIALLKETHVGDFELNVKLQSTNVNAGPHRDLCLFWGYQDPNHFYYVHLGARSDPNACQIFIVNDAPRRPITVKQAKGTPWTIGWHDVRIVRRIADGTVEVYFDDMEKPLMTAQNNALQWGQVGLGTFDDHGNWDDFTLRGVEAATKASSAAKSRRGRWSP